MIHLNCDMGEGVGNEELLTPFLDACNIACGGHAGNEQLMRHVVKLATKHNVSIGAHPSYPDKENFGRVSLSLTENQLTQTIREQISLLETITAQENTKLAHIKPHGALYNDVAKDALKARQFLKAIEIYKDKYTLFVPYNSVIANLAKAQHFKLVFEAFADRNYNDDLSLVSRKNKDAILHDLEAIIQHISTIHFEEKVTTISGKKIPFKATTFCVHSDTENAVGIVQKIHEKFHSKPLTAETNFPKISPLGKQGILLEWQPKMSENVLYSVLEAKEIITKNYNKLIVEVIQSINSLLVVYKNKKIDFEAFKHLLETQFSTQKATNVRATPICWEIPVCYDVKFAIDIEELVQKNNLSIKEIITLHTTPKYLVYSIGFLPGFMYLGGLDKRLHIDRKNTPRQHVEKGAVGIGGMQTGIYPRSSPGGWQIIGNSPLDFFNPKHEKPCLIQPGDQITFKAISLEEYTAIKSAVAEKKYTPKIVQS